MRPFIEPFLRPALPWMLPMLAAAAFAADAPAAPPALAVESCVSPARIVFAGDDLRVMLDETERAAVFEQLLRRYPVLHHDGVVPSHIVLWRQTSGAWLYVTLLQHPQQPDQWCFTASFVAGNVDITTALLRKYFALRAA